MEVLQPVKVYLTKKEIKRLAAAAEAEGRSVSNYCRVKLELDVAATLVEAIDSKKKARQKRP